MLSANKIQPEVVNLDTLATTIHEVTGVARGQLTSRCKDRDVCDARHIAFHILYGRRYTLAEIGKSFGRTQGSVQNGLKRIRLDMERDFRVRVRVERVNQLIDLSDPLDVLRIAYEGRG